MRAIILILFSILAFLACEKETLKFELVEGESFKEINKEYRKIVRQSFIFLSSELKEQMRLGGVEQGIKACNVKAPEIENKLSKNFEMTIRRTSDKYRNLDNKPDDIDSEILDIYLKNNDKKPKLIKTADGIRYYFPIKTLPLCLSCHGDIDSQIGKENYALIKKLYPDDNATGYKKDDFRGLWVLENDIENK